MTKSVSKISLYEILQNAIRYQQAGQLEEAEQCCMQVCEIVPDQADALHLLAIINAQAGRHEKANHYFSQAIASDPLRADFYSNYANALWEQGCIDEAIKCCQRALALDAGRAETHNILGSVFLSQNRLKAAAASFRQALHFHANYPHALNNLGNVLQKMDQAEEAVTYYHQALKLRENYPEAHNNLGQALKSIGRIDDARKHFRRAVELRPTFRKAQQNCVEVDPVWLQPLDGHTLHLRRYCAEDAPYLHQCYQSAVFMAQYNHYIPRHQHIDDLAKQLRHAHSKHPCQLKAVDWIILNKKTRQPVGVANLAEIQFVHQRAEFLIGLPNPADHTRGMGLEAALLVLDYVFNRVGLNKLTAIVYADNVSSQKNSLALGFVQESYLRDQIMDSASGKFISLYGNGMTVRDFRTNMRLPKLSQRLLGRDITRSN